MRSEGGVSQLIHPHALGFFFFPLLLLPPFQLLQTKGRHLMASFISIEKAAAGPRLAVNLLKDEGGMLCLMKIKMKTHLLVQKHKQTKEDKDFSAALLALGLHGAEEAALCQPQQEQRTAELCHWEDAARLQQMLCASPTGRSQQRATSNHIQSDPCHCKSGALPDTDS